MISRPHVLVLVLFGTLLAICFTPARHGAIAQGATPEPGEVVRDCAECPELVVVPSGEFDMGANDTPYEKPIHKVTIASPFAVGRREVTFAEWDECNAAGDCKYRPDDHRWGRGTRPGIDGSW